MQTSTATSASAGAHDDARTSPPSLTRRALVRQTLYEFVLTFVLLFGAATAVRWFVAPSAISRAVGNVHLEVALVGCCVAILVTALILSPLGRVSGGHMNPAISVAMWRYRVFPRNAVTYYVAAQLIGSVLGVLTARIVWGAIVAERPVTYAALQPAHGWSAWELLAAETATMSTIILIVGLLLASPRLAAAVPFAVGLLVGATIAGLGTITGGSANPARQFGPALVSGQTRFLWVYLLAPIAGAAIAPVLRDRFQRRGLTTHALCGPAAERQPAPA
jgi:glycerol uptake facilitator-like aquaporin